MPGPDDDLKLVKQTIAQMWTDFERDATKIHSRKLPIEVRLAYYTAAHTMLAKVMALFRSTEANNWKEHFQNWIDEVPKFVTDFNGGKL